MKHRKTVQKKYIIMISLTSLLLLNVGVAVLHNQFYPKHYRKGLSLAEKTDLTNVDCCHIKEGYYCGEGGIDCDHGDGFIYYTEPLTEAEAMKQSGFDYIKEDKEYSDGGDHAQIRKVSRYKEGFLLWYVITGTA